MGHEIVQVYDGEFCDPSVYEKEYLDCNEHPDTAHTLEVAMPFRAVWKSLDEFGPGAPLYPDGLADMLMNQIQECKREKPGLAHSCTLL